MPTNDHHRSRTLLIVPSDADSLTERDVDAPSDVAAARGNSNGDVDVESVAAAGGPNAEDGVDAEAAQAVDADLAVDAEAAQAVDADLAVDAEIAQAVDADLDEAFTDADDEDDGESPFGDELRLPDENGYDGEEYDDDEYLEDGFDGDEVLFDGDPEEFELDLGVSVSPVDRPEAGDLLVLDDAAANAPGPRPLRMSRLERRRRVRLQARRVRRIIRHIEPWSVLKISVFFYACLWVIFLVAGFMIWGVAEGSGTVDKLESLIRSLFALETFDFDASQIFKGYALGGLALSIAGTAFNVLMCLLFNLISDLTGGLRITMIEEETARPTPPRRRRRRPPSQRRPPPQRRP